MTERKFNKIKINDTGNNNDFVFEIDSQQIRYIEKYTIERGLTHANVKIEFSVLTSELDLHINDER